MARTLVASDNFNRASLGTDWSQVCTIRGNIVINSSTRVWGEYAAIGDDHPTAKWVGAGTFTDDQYSSAVLLDSTPTGSTYRFGVIVRASAGTNATRDYYEAYVALITGLVTTHLVKMVDGAVAYTYSSSSPTWADNDRIELEVQGNTLRVCKNGTPLGGGFTYTDSSSPLTTGLPGISVTNQMYLDNWEGGNITAGDTAAPTLTSPTGTGGTLACSGSVSTDEANGTLYAVVTASATAPTAAQVKLGQDHTGAAALRVVSQAVTATGAQTLASGSVTAGTRYWHCMHEDAATNQSAVVSSASFVVSSGSAAVSFSGTVPAQSGTVGTASTALALASYFSGTFTPFTYSVFSGALPGGLTLNTSTGQISGTPTTAGSFSAVVRATDTATNTANTGTISWTVLAAMATTATVTLTTDGTTPAASLTGLKWAYWDVLTPDLMTTAPLVKGSAETTDASGVLTVTITGTTKRVGEVGYLLVTNSDGTTTQGAALRAFAAPVTVS